jgi:hypothetical protein
MLNYLRGLSLDVELLKPKQVESFEDVENSSL